MGKRSSPENIQYRSLLDRVWRFSHLLKDLGRKKDAKHADVFLAAGTG